MFNFLRKNKKSISNPNVDNALLGKDLDFASAEAYNLLRTNLAFSLTDKNGEGHIVGVSSACPQEGKSYTSINLAYSLAKNGNKVLLIDGDMRKPTVANVLKVKSKYGLSNIIAGQTEDAIVQSELHENLSIIFSGTIPPNPSELLGSNKMKEIIKEFSKKFNYIIVDLPPITAVADPIIASSFLDGVVLIVKHGYSHKTDVKEAIRRLKFAKTHILGIVYNGFTTDNRHKYNSKHYKKYVKGYYKNNNAEELNSSVK